MAQKNNDKKKQKQTTAGKKNGQEKVAIQQKKRQSGESKSGRCCKWFWGSSLLLVLIVGVLVYDTQVNGKGVFAKSAVGKVLKDVGALPYVETAWYTSMGASARAYKWAEKHVPPYANPAFQLLSDFFKLTRNAVCNILNNFKLVVQQKLPVAAAFLEQYVPGLPQKIENSSIAVKHFVVDVYIKIFTFFQTQVFVGCLSPENLSRALNDTQNAASEYYNLFHQKVDAYAKLK